MAIDRCTSPWHEQKISNKMKAYTYIEHNRFELIDKPKPTLQGPKDALVRVTVNVETFCGECFGGYGSHHRGRSNRNLYTGMRDSQES